jgi:hypothetical protein
VVDEGKPRDSEYSEIRLSLVYPNFYLGSDL